MCELHQNDNELCWPQKYIEMEINLLEIVLFCVVLYCEFHYAQTTKRISVSSTLASLSLQKCINTKNG